MHKYGWYYWEALSDKKLSTVDPERYLQKLKMQEHRKKAVDVLRQLKRNGCLYHERFLKKFLHHRKNRTILRIGDGHIPRYIL